MAKVNNIKRIIAEDFDSDYQNLIRQLSFTLNPLLEQLTNAFNKNIDFDNLNQEIIPIQTEVDSSGVPKSTLEVKTTLKTKIKGIMVISAINLTDGALLVGAPFINYDLITGGFKIKQVTGIVPNKSYSLSILLIG